VSEVHTYDTKFIPARDIDSTCVLVGESGGLSAVYDNTGASGLLPGLLCIETEHGWLYLDAELEVEVLA
jgi:hypothetical protein